MKKRYHHILWLAAFFILLGCSSSYKASPLPFKHPSAYPNTLNLQGAAIGAEAFADKEGANKAFGFDIRSAGILPVQIVVDNQGKQSFYIVADQTFLLDNEGNMWPVLSDRFAYERVTKYAQTKHIFKKGAYSGTMTGIAGAIIGAAIGIVTGDNVAASAGKGAAVGAAAGATAGGLKGYGSAHQARMRVMEDFENKSLQNKLIPTDKLSYGIIFFPGEAGSVRSVRLQLKSEKSGEVYTVNLKL